jgi:hypothetical protein
MATNLTLNQQPELWNSAYSDIEYIFDFDAINISSVTNPSGTICRVTVASAFAVNPPINSYCFISTGLYVGLWKVTGSTSTTVDIDATFAGTQTTGTLKSLRLPTFTLYKGFQATEDFPTELPYSIVTTFTHSFNSNNQLVINLKGLIQRIFTITEPDLNADFDFSSFNAFRLEYDGDVTDIRYALNSSISTEELNNSYLANGAYLVPTELPIMFGCGISFMTRFVNGFPTLQIYNGGEQTVVGFSNAFQTNQFNQGLDIN